jgi:hypothetical protein
MTKMKCCEYDPKPINVEGSFHDRDMKQEKPKKKFLGRYFVASLANAYPEKALLLHSESGFQRFH